ncbi:MAG: chromate transporter [Alphaproteobacteria bacterium]
MKNNPVVPFSEALAVWVRIGLLSFGGPAGQIALMHRILVEEKRWIGEKRFLHALNYCMLLPGPEAQQLAVYIGWLLHRTIGGLTAGLLFILPGLAVVLTLSTVYALFHKTHILMMIFYGLKPAVVAMVALALWRLSRRALHTSFHLILAILAFIALFVFAVPFPFVILGAGTVGLIATRLRPEYFSPVAHPVLSSSTAKIEPLLSDAPMDPVSWHATGKVAIVCFVLWLGPVFGAGAWLGWHSTLAEVGIFFSKMALVTFGGAYAVLSYVAQQAVSHYGWLGTDEMVDGLALAESDPGPAHLDGVLLLFLPVIDTATLRLCGWD